MDFVGQLIDPLKVDHDQGTDRLLQTNFRLFGRTIYERGLPDAQKAIVDEAQAKGQIDYFQIDNLVKAALQIAKLVPVDLPITMVPRLISSYQKVTVCRLEKNEKLSTFASRFRSPAAKHLLHSQASSSLQIGEALAISLLNKAMLEEEIFTYAKLQLIAHAVSRAKNEEKGSFTFKVLRSRFARQE